jgi:hypothetical protein
MAAQIWVMKVEQEMCRLFDDRFSYYLDMTSKTENTLIDLVCSLLNGEPCSTPDFFLHILTLHKLQDGKCYTMKSGPTTKCKLWHDGSCTVYTQNHEGYHEFNVKPKTM